MFNIIYNFFVLYFNNLFFKFFLKINFIKIIMHHLSIKSCVVCWNWFEYLCPDCHKKIKFFLYKCPICNKFSKNSDICKSCLFEIKNLSWIMVCFKYNLPIKKLLYCYKFNSKYDIWKYIWKEIILSILTNEFYLKLISNNKTLLTYVPSNDFKKFFIRGFDNMEFLTKIVWKYFKKEVHKIIVNRKLNKQQSSLNKTQRAKNLEKTYFINTFLKLDTNSYENVIIFDDLLTTWTTLYKVSSIINWYFRKLKIYSIVISKNV